MHFRTELHLQKSTFQISHSSKILSLGSCFAECMGKRLQRLQFDTLSNPFGTLYNPISIFQNLSNCLDATLDKAQVLETRNTFYHYQFHSQVLASSKNELLEKIDTIQKETKTRIHESKFLFLTLGTSYVYFLNENSVANCHKMPLKNFTKRFLSVKEITSQFELLLTKLKKANPEIQIILTVSPVRHIKDTLELNSVSKAILRLACHYIAEKHQKIVAYFPAYELLTDDLRDYRFYADDLIHPNNQAENYIWEKFSTMFFSEETISTNIEIEEIEQGLAHRAFQPTSEEYRLFLASLSQKIKKLEKKVKTTGLLEKLALKMDT
jgi:hypothetical protein